MKRLTLTITMLLVAMLMAAQSVQKEVQLTGMYKKGYLPPYIYTTGQILGEAGKTYTLTVETADYHATATTTIPQPVPLTGLEALPYDKSDTTWLINAKFRDPAGERNYYKFFTRIRQVDSTYIPARLSLVNDAMLDSGGESQVTLMPGAALFLDRRDRPCFFSGETVSVRFCTMDAQMAEIWQSFDSEAAHTAAPILSATTNIPGNVDGALGYFAGYGSSKYKITLP